ncbi:MAG: hypothetical protein V1776_04930 [Candidatus Diapherotrites archaeon]
MPSTKVVSMQKDLAIENDPAYRAFMRALDDLKGGRVTVLRPRTK